GDDRGPCGAAGAGGRGYLAEYRRLVCGGQSPQSGPYAGAGGDAAAAEAVRADAGGRDALGAAGVRTGGAARLAAGATGVTGPEPSPDSPYLRRSWAMAARPTRTMTARRAGGGRRRPRVA